MTKATLFQHRSLRGAKRPSRCWAGNIARAEQKEGMLLVARARPGVSAVPTGWITSALETRPASLSTLRLESPQIPGINAYHGDVSVVCLIAGDVVAVLEEERVRRVNRGRESSRTPFAAASASHGGAPVSQQRGAPPGPSGERVLRVRLRRGRRAHSDRREEARSECDMTARPSVGQTLWTGRRPRATHQMRRSHAPVFSAAGEAYAGETPRSPDGYILPGERNKIFCNI